MSRKPEPKPYRAAILDMDGVLTRTVELHARAWKVMFDEFLEARCEPGVDFQPFDMESDYRRFVDGKPRYDGVRSFLESRGLQLPEGTPEDSPGEESVFGLGNRKNELFHELLVDQGVEVYPDAVERVEEWRSQGLRTALVTSSRNGSTIVESAKLAPLFDVILDGEDTAELGLPGKPAPDIFLEAARLLNVQADEALVVEDAVSGVEAGRAGGFGLVVGVDRNGGGELGSHGANLVVRDLSDPVLEKVVSPPAASSALDHLDELLDRMTQGRLALFLDYDGTLTPIVPRPEDATLSPAMRDLLETLSDSATVAVVSGRDLADVQGLVRLEGLRYAGSHGFDIAGPAGLRMQHEEAQESLPDLDEVEADLTRALDEVDGARVERKHFAIAVHYRDVAEEAVSQVEEAVDRALEGSTGLRKKGGKKIFEVQPDVKWDKGRAVLWLLEELGLTSPDVVPVYIGDDVTDEDAFEALRDHGLGIRVGPEDEETAAHYTLPDTDELERLFRELAKRLADGAGPGGRHREVHP